MDHSLPPSFPMDLAQRGQGMTEYLIIVALIAITGIAVFSFFGQTLRHQVAGISQELSGKQTTEIQQAQATAQQAVDAASKKKSMSDYKADVYN
ncbi:MAG: Flp family type IVb pilin [Sulfuriferula sp.]